jgi:hypothetical protein
MSELLLSPPGIALGAVIALALLGAGSSARSEQRQSGAGGLLWCAFVLVAVVGSAWLFNFPHGGDGGRLDGRAGFGGAVFGDVFGLNNREGR